MKLKTLRDVAFHNVIIVNIFETLLFTVNVNCNNENSETDELLIKIDEGYLKGIKRTSVLKHLEYHSFLGIPYAEAPDNELRFKDPVPKKPWSGTRDATHYGNICPQYDVFSKKLAGKEDCLFLNVYSPKINEPKQKRPVMVWVHGGSFQNGSGNDDFYGPDFLIEKDIILVTMNYRVGVLGFLNMGNTDVPGNAGLKDQVLALKWVKNNICYFGGDSENVTLFGESSGSVAVHFHTLSLMSQGLFHRVIMESGCVLNPGSFNKDPLPRAFQLGEVFGKVTRDSKELVLFLRKQKFEDLILNQDKIINEREKKKLAYPFVPSKEIAGSGSHFLLEDPETLLKKGSFAAVPYIIGMNDKEGLIILTEEALLTKNFKEINGNPITFVPDDLCTSNDTCNCVASKVKKFYFDNAPVSTENLSEYFDLNTDLLFTIGINKTIDYLKKKGTDIHVYLFTFEGKAGYMKSLLQKYMPNLPPGVCHGDEVFYIFNNNYININQLPTPEKKVIDSITTLWTNLAKNSFANKISNEVDWKRIGQNAFQYLNIGEKLKMVDSELMPKRSTFWKNIYSSSNHCQS